jgi:two-component system, NarL family, response regulator LiaR
MNDENTAAGTVGRTVRVLIGDQDPLVRRVVRDALRVPWISVIGEAGDGQEVVELARRHQPDVVLMDVVLPELDGPSVIRRIVSASPVVRVVMLTAADAEDAGIAGLKAGASGYVSKDTDLDSLPRIIQAVVRGEPAVSRSFVSVLIDRLRAAPEGHIGLRPVRSPLTPREWEVLDLLCAGLSDEEVADALVLSPETIRSHIQRSMRKLGVRSRSAAIDAVAGLRASAAAVPALAG